MAEKTTPQEESKGNEKEFVIPLRNEWRKVANYRRTGRAVKFIKAFIARHMKIPERDVSKVKLDIYLNQEIWFRGRKKPPAKIKVKVRKEGDIFKVSLAELPKHWEYEQAKQAKRHKIADKPKAPEPKVEEKKEDLGSSQGVDISSSSGKREQSSALEERGRSSKSVSEKTASEKKAESEKEQSVADLRAADAKQQAKQQKQSKVKEMPIHRKALKK